MTTFDPYHVWLGIPPSEQPPNHYRLLAIALFEASPEVIENAAERQMAHVRRAAHGKHADESQRILNEIAAAQRALLDAARKAKYDAELRAAQAAPGGYAQTMEWTPAHGRVSAPPLAAPPAEPQTGRWKKPPKKAPPHESPAEPAAPPPAALAPAAPPALSLALAAPSPSIAAKGNLRARAKRRSPAILIAVLAIVALLPVLALVAALAMMNGGAAIATGEPTGAGAGDTAVVVEPATPDGEPKSSTDEPFPKINEPQPQPITPTSNDKRDPFDDSPSFGRTSGQPVLEQSLKISARTLLPRLAFFSLPAEARTPIEVKQGQIVKLKIDGEWRIAPSEPRGIDALYIAVGHAGQPASQFAQGAREVEFNVQKDGWLFMGVEDLLNFDNSGEMNVAVSVY